MAELLNNTTYIGKNVSNSYETFNHSQHLNVSSKTDANTILKAVFVVVVMAIAFIGNIFIVFSFFHNFKMRTITNTLVVNLCFTDAFSCALDLSFYAAVIGSWSFAKEQTACQVLFSFDHLLKVASILSMTGIALDRYFNLVRTAKRRMTLARARIVISWCWIQSLIAAVPWNLSTSTSSNLRKKLCSHFPYFFEPGMGIESISVFFKITCVLLPILFIYYVSHRIIKAVRRKRKIEVEETTSGVVTGISTERFAVQAFARSGLTAIILFGMYILCTAPFVVAILWTLASHEQILSLQIGFTVYYFFKLKCALFPILYISRNRIILGWLRQKLSCCVNSERTLTIIRDKNLAFKTNNSSMQMLPRNRLGMSAAKPNDNLKCNKCIVNDFVDLRALESSSVNT